MRRNWRSRSPEYAPTADSALYIGVNVYSDHVESRGFASDVTRSAKAILPRLVLNMSQHRGAAPTIDVQGTVAALRARRVRFALTDIDDAPPDPLLLEFFGFEQVKFDRRIMTLDEEERRQRLNALVRAVRPSGATVIAEGVESVKHHEAASQSGVDLAQGYFYARTMPLSLLLTFLAAGGQSLRMRKKKRWKLR